MRLIDEIHPAKPFLGIRLIKDALNDLGYKVNCKHSTTDAENGGSGVVNEASLFVEAA